MHLQKKAACPAFVPLHSLKIRKRIDSFKNKTNLTAKLITP